MIQYPNIDELPPAKREAMERALRHIEAALTVVAVLNEQMAMTRCLTGLLREYSSLRALGVSERSS